MLVRAWCPEPHSRWVGTGDGTGWGRQPGSSSEDQTWCSRTPQCRSDGRKHMSSLNVHIHVTAASFTATETEKQPDASDGWVCKESTACQAAQGHSAIKSATRSKAVPEPGARPGREHAVGSEGSQTKVHGNVQNGQTRDRKHRSGGGQGVGGGRWWAGGSALEGGRASRLRQRLWVHRL